MREIIIKFGNAKLRVLYLKTHFQLGLGLMFRKEGNALLEFRKEGKYRIWTLFMRYPLDLVFFDENREMIDLIRNIPPISFNPKTWKIYRPKKKCKYLLELDTGKRIQLSSNFNF